MMIIQKSLLLLKNCCSQDQVVMIKVVELAEVLIMIGLSMAVEVSADATKGRSSLFNSVKVLYLMTVL